MRPIEQDLAALRVEHDVLLTETRRRERSAHRISRSDLKAAMEESKLRTVAELVAGSDSGSLDNFGFNLKTGPGFLKTGPGFLKTGPGFHVWRQNRPGDRPCQGG